MCSLQSNEPMMGRSRLFIAKNVLLRRGGGYTKTVILIPSTIIHTHHEAGPVYASDFIKTHTMKVVVDGLTLLLRIWGGPLFKSPPAYRLHWLRFSVVFLSPSRQILG
jgi:hypothetical protein